MPKPKNKKISDLSIISDIETLEQLSKFDKNIRAYAVIKIKDPYLADDIVNDMYIKVHGFLEKGTKISGGYVIMMINSIFMNKMKFEQRYNGDESNTELNDESDIERKINDEEKYEFIEKLIEENLNWYEQKVLTYSLEMTIVELSNKSGIPYASLLTCYNKIKKKLGIEKVKIKKNKTK